MRFCSDRTVADCFSARQIADALSGISAPLSPTLNRVDYLTVDQFGRLVGLQVGICERFQRLSDTVRGGQFDGPRRPYPAPVGNPYFKVVHREQSDTSVDFTAFADVMPVIRVEQFVQAFSRVHFDAFHGRIRSDLVFEAGGDCEAPTAFVAPETANLTVAHHPFVYIGVDFGVAVRRFQPCSAPSASLTVNWFHASPPGTPCGT